VVISINILLIKRTYGSVVAVPPIKVKLPWLVKIDDETSY
jgi:hypothetical protein